MSRKTFAQALAEMEPQSVTNQIVDTVLQYSGVLARLHGIPEHFDLDEAMTALRGEGVPV